ncbi:uncharacterized protein [Penaeus vannamei]|uniref:uncharacterized protein n=1 Tax=Penaeus vannamei TaxID=6689 RepID=UPI00387F804D
MVLRLKLVFGFICKLNVKEMFYASENSPLFQSCASSQKLRISGSWYQHSDPHHWTLYSDAGNAAKEIDHILINIRWRILQNYRVFRRPEFCGTDHKLVVATLWVHFKTRQWSNDHPQVLHLDRLREVECVWGFAEAVSSRFTVLDNLVDPKILEATDACHMARLTGGWDLHSSQVRKTRSLLRRDKEQFNRSLAEKVEGHSLVIERPAYQALRKLNSKPSSQVTAVRSVGGQIISDPVVVLFNLDVGSANILLLDPSISENPTILTEVRRAIYKLRSGKAAGSIPVELLKTDGELMLQGLHAVLAAIWQSGTISPDLLRECILVLRVIVESHRELRRGLLAAYIDLKKAFDTCCKVWWRLVKLFPLSLGVRQGCVLAHHTPTVAWTGYWAELLSKVIVEQLFAILRGLLDQDPGLWGLVKRTCSAGTCLRRGH